MIRSILIGVQLANDRLARLADGSGVRGIEQLELLELYEDRALETVHLLRGLRAMGFEHFEITPELVRAPGQQRRASYREPGAGGRRSASSRRRAGRRCSS